MKSKKIIWFAGVSLALFLNACGGQAADHTATDQTGQQIVPGQESGQEAGSGAEGQNADGQTATGQGTDGYLRAVDLLLEARHDG